MNNQTEFIKLTQENDRIIHKVVSLYTDTPQDGEDLYQEILLQLWKSYSNYRGEAAFSTFMYRVALNVALTFLKKAKRNKMADLESVPQSFTKADEQKDYEVLYLIIKSLSVADRMIITLHLDGYKNGEIAEIVGINTNSANVKIHRIKNKISEKFKSISHGH